MLDISARQLMQTPSDKVMNYLYQHFPRIFLACAAGSGILIRVWTVQVSVSAGSVSLPFIDPAVITRHVSYNHITYVSHRSGLDLIDEWDYHIIYAI